MQGSTNTITVLSAANLEEEEEELGWEQAVSLSS